MIKGMEEKKLVSIGHLNIYLEKGREWPVKFEMRRDGIAVYDKYALSCVQDIIDVLQKAVKECNEFIPSNMIKWGR